MPIVQTNGYSNRGRVSSLKIVNHEALSLFVLRKFPEFIALCCLLLCVSCQTTTPLTPEEKERLAQEEAAMKERYLKRIQSVEESCYEVLDALGPKVIEFNENEAIGYSGAIFSTGRFYPMDLEKAVVKQGMGDFVSVRYIVEGSPADEGGLLLGDRLVRMNGVKVPKGERASTFVVEKMGKLWLVDESNLLVVDRNGEEITLEIDANRSISYSVIVTPFIRDSVYAEGKAIYFPLEGMEGLEEQELDYICAHALVQNVMKHARMKGQNEFIGSVLDLAAAVSGVNTGGIFSSMGRNAHKAGFQIESDILALYALANAGVDISGYPDFWEEKLLSEKKVMDRVSRERVEAMRQVVAEIEEKRLNGEPIYPTEYLAGEWERIDPLEMSDPIETRSEEIEVPVN